MVHANAGDFLGCRRIKGEVFIWQDKLKFKVLKAELVGGFDL